MEYNKISYDPTVWVDNGTAITAEKLNHIEDGIKQATDTMYTVVPSWVGETKPTYTYPEIGGTFPGIDSSQIDVSACGNTQVVTGLTFDSSTGKLSTSVREQVGLKLSGDSQSLSETQVLKNISLSYNSAENTNVISTQYANLSPVAISGRYSDISNAPTVPTKMSQLDNDKRYITSDDIYQQANGEYLGGIVNFSDEFFVTGFPIFKLVLQERSNTTSDIFSTITLFEKDSGQTLTDGSKVTFVSDASTLQYGFKLSAQAGKFLNYSGNRYVWVAYSVVSMVTFSDDLYITSDIGEIQLGESPCYKLETSGKSVQDVLESIVTKKRDSLVQLPLVDITLSSDHLRFDEIIGGGKSTEGVKATVVLTDGYYYFDQSSSTTALQCKIESITCDVTVSVEGIETTYSRTITSTSGEEPTSVDFYILDENDETIPSIKMSTSNVSISFTITLTQSTVDRKDNLGNSIEKVVIDPFSETKAIRYYAPFYTLVSSEDYLNNDSFATVMGTVSSDSIQKIVESTGVSLSLDSNSKSCALTVPAGTDIKRIISGNVFNVNIKNNFVKIENKTYSNINYDIYYLNFGKPYSNNTTLDIKLD